MTRWSGAQSKIAVELKRKSDMDGSVGIGRRTAASCKILSWIDRKSPTFTEYLQWIPAIALRLNRTKKKKTR